MRLTHSAGGRLRASAWGWAAVIATVLSAAGYALQTLLDWIPAPGPFEFAVFWGLFAGDAAIAFLTGVVAVAQAWAFRRPDSTLRFGLVGIGWLPLAQVIQTVWD